MITIREVTVQDAEEITMLSHQLGYSIFQHQTLQNIKGLKQSNDYEVFVAVHEQQVIGWMGVSYHISLESLPLCEVHGLVVNEKHRGQGVGKMLIEEAKQWSREKGVSKLRLRCNIKRAGAISFYQKIGFIEAKQQKVFEIMLDS